MAKVLGFQINIQGTDKSIESAEQLKRAIADLQKELKKTEDVEAIKNLEKQLVDLKARQQEVNATVRDEIKLRRQELNAVDEVSGTYDKLSRTLNDQRKRYKDLAAAGKEFSDEAVKLRGDINELDKRLKGIDANVGQFQRNVGGYTQALEQFFPRITRNFGEVANGFKAAQGAAGGFNKALGFIGVAVTAITAVVDALQTAKETAKEFTDVQRSLAQTTNLSKAELEAQSGTIIAIARTYETSSKEVVAAANALSKEFNISIGDSLALVEAGFRKGADAQGDFIDQLREYPAVVRDTVGSAENLVRVLIVAREEGIYSDKGIDAIKEFDLRIKEQTTATRAALEGAFGGQFTSKIFSGLNDGSITTAEALKRISKGLQDTSLTAQQTQTVIADVFGGPGEDAGIRYLQRLGDIIDATDSVTISTNKYEEEQSALFKSNEILAQSQAALSDSINASSKGFTIFWNTVKTIGNTIILAFTEQIRSIANNFAAIGAVIKGFINTDGNLIQKLQGGFAAGNKAILDQRIEFIKASRQAREEELAQQKAANDITSNTEAALNRRLQALKDQRAKLEIGSADFKRLTKEIEKTQEQLDKAGGKAGRTAGKTTGEQFIEGSIAAIEKEANRLKAAIENAVAGSDTQAALIQAYNKQQKILEDAIAARNRAEFEGQRQAQLANLANLEAIGQGTALAQAKIVSQSVEKQNEGILKQMQAGAKVFNEQRQKQLTDEKAQLDKQREQTLAYIEQGVNATFNLISTLTAAANEKRNQIFEREIESTEARIADIEERANKATGIRKRLLEQQAAAEKKNLEEQTKRAEKEREKQAKNEKKIAIVQSIINGALAVQRALAFPPGPPATVPSAIAAGVFAAIQTATIAAQPLATGGVAGISGRRVTDRQNMPTRSNGDNVLATLKRGEVVLNAAQQTALGGSNTFRRIGVPGFASGGMVAPAITAPALPPSLTKDSNAMLMALDRKTDAINQRIDRLRAYVVTEDITRDIADGESVRVKAEL